MIKSDRCRETKGLLKYLAFITALLSQGIKLKILVLSIKYDHFLYNIKTSPAS